MKGEHMIIKNVFEVVDQALEKKPEHVWIEWKAVDRQIEKMGKDGPPAFFEDTEQYKTGIQIEVLKELVASSINYCYWYGTSDIRPNNVSSTAMYECLEYAFNQCKGFDIRFDRIIYTMIELLSVNRFPMLEERKRHLLELLNDRRAENFVHAVTTKQADIDMMCRYFQGFASDIFLKRASLFFIQIYRKFGWYKDIELPVPADYQVPKILNHFGCLQYSARLEEDIYEGKLIPKHSIEEIQIRAATIKICEKMRQELGWHIGDVDTYLWTKRKLTDKPFHCTITTDY
jgi:hypothetical protein